MSVREKGRKKIKQETSTQYKVTDLISMADLEHIHLRKGRSYSSKPPPLSTKTWEEVRREKEERILKARRKRALSTPLETTSTDAMDTEEAQEISKEIVEKAAEREICTVSNMHSIKELNKLQTIKFLRQIQFLCQI